MKNVQLNKTSNLRWSGLRYVFSVVLMLAILAAALPQPAQAAVTCRTYHWVKESDTTPYISHTYGLKWWQIAQANEMKPWEPLEVGQRLCIPAADQVKETTKKTSEKDKEKTGVRVDYPADDPKAKISVSITGKRVYLSLSNFAEDHTYLVKARDVDLGVGGWYKLGTKSIEDKKSYSFAYDLPQKLWNVPVLSVCLKDQTSDELICRTAVNP